MHFVHQRRLEAITTTPTTTTVQYSDLLKRKESAESILNKGFFFKKIIYKLILDSHALRRQQALTRARIYSNRLRSVGRIARLEAARRELIRGRVLAAPEVVSTLNNKAAAEPFTTNNLQYAARIAANGPTINESKFL